ncbi:unnamed protein product [Caenorhabditis angaria]|uniref:Secreted protein n=1 Tax=Caenorhabditis angaria TaxID=860376 RepID=A0A9P1IGU1_9PELO|nr:unnamed protein product [Caenorhabditis angaria]
MLGEAIILAGVIFALLMVHKQDIAKGGDGIPFIGHYLDEIDDFLKRLQQQNRRRNINDSEMKTARSLSGQEKFEPIEPRTRSSTRNRHHRKHRSKNENDH